MLPNAPIENVNLNTQSESEKNKDPSVAALGVEQKISSPRYNMPSTKLNIKGCLILLSSAHHYSFTGNINDRCIDFL